MSRVLDDMDRKILGALAEDATQSFAQLGKIVGLSAPAVHERVKRLRANKTIKATVAQLDGPQTGKPLLAFIHVNARGWAKTKGLTALAERPEVEEIHSATGDTCLIMKVRVASSYALEGLLSQIYDLPEVQRTQTYVALSTHLERSVQAGVSPELAKGGYLR
ncbi:MAG: Lrp/AsnC family transcriptional regulator [Pseudoruegeria sp.]